VKKRLAEIRQPFYLTAGIPHGPNPSDRFFPGKFQSILKFFFLMAGLQGSEVK
jgi:hypothetical protein